MGRAGSVRLPERRGCDVTRLSTCIDHGGVAAVAKGGATGRAVVIGASTGGIEALLTVLSGYPKACPPTLIVQHIRPEFTDGVIRRLDGHCAAHVAPARDGAPLASGHIYVAPGGAHHLQLRGTDQAAYCKLRAGEPVSGHRPSVDMLFQSAARFATGVIGVLLTGMGRDGAQGLLEIRRNGGHTIAQNRATCIVHGMPRVASEIGAVTEELPLREIGPAILRGCREVPPHAF